ncbi:glycosyltransferase family 4 protein [Ectopseudomonas oleovorans]|uniref:glycosyltransferase family 4 protein n=1 Tax=Ectopseudomonas oleovorans TaxID=301 RepID=UPI00244966BA|nr:glycosyltransferase family 4 protein [Pseudomonas oleovorans]MDH2201457.1 glycosyltransferase family 4 protein [Pseudomonas oleovorans]
MRILFISQLFDPEYSIKGLGLMMHWIEQGHEVEVITTFPNYPTGRVFPGYKRKLKQVEVINGVKVIRLWSHISHSKSKLSRAATYLSYTIAALFYAFFSKKPDVVYAYHPQATTGLIGILLKKLKGVPFITDVQDLWPDALVATGLNKAGLVVRLIDRWCRIVYMQASAIVVLSQGFRQALVARGVSESKIRVVYNWCPEELRISEAIENQHNKAIDEKSSARVVYAGNIGAAQSLVSLIDAVGTFSASSLVLELYGNGVEKEELEALVKSKRYANVSFKGYVPSSDIFDVLVGADILAVHLRRDPLFEITIPSKTQSSMAIGKPMLMAVGGEVNDLVIQAGAGVVAEPQSVESIQKALRLLLAKKSDWKNMGKSARDFYEQNFSSRVNYQKLDDVLRDVSRDNS